MINRAVLSHDLKLILRDPLIIFFAVIPLILEILFHTIRKLNLVSSLPFTIDSQTLEVLFRCLLPFFGGMIGGWMCGFMILEEKEEEMDLLLRTVPLNEGEIFLTRLVLTLLISLSANTVLLIADSLFFGFNPYLMLIFAASASIGPFFMILLFRFGRNRVQGAYTDKTVQPDPYSANTIAVSEGNSLLGVRGFISIKLVFHGLPFCPGRRSSFKISPHRSAVYGRDLPISQ